MEDLGMRIIAGLKRYGWATNLLFIFTGAYFVASAISGVVAGEIRGVPTLASAAQASTPSRPPNRRSTRQDPKLFKAMAHRNLFGAQRENLDPVAEAPGRGKTEINLDDLRKCTMPASLRGTLVAEGAPEWSLAVIYVNAKKQVGVFSTNDGSNEISSGLTLHEIRSRAVVVQRNDHLELCQAEGEGKKTGQSSGRSRVTARTDNNNSGDEQSVRKVSESEYEIDRSYIDGQLAQLSKVVTQARIVPSFKNGKSNGFKLFSIKPGSIYAKIGMQNGDVVQRINGYEMNSPEKGLEIYSKLKTESTITVDFLRRGQTQSRTYNIR